MTNRREFLRRACALAALAGVPARVKGAAQFLGRPDLVIGLLSDIHISMRPGSDPVAATRMFRHALEYFRDRHVDGVLISGDLANAGLETELKAVADAWFAVFPDGKLLDGSPVANLMHYGDHDAESRFYTERLKEGFRKAGAPVPRSLSERENRRVIWEACFHEPWSPIRHVKVKGFDFVLSNFMREGGASAPKDLARRLKALNLDPKRPFFYSQHRYIGGTYLADEEMWGGDNGVAGKVLPSFPNAVAFQGHTHYMLTDDRGVWIGDYITVNSGSLLDAACGRVRENGVDISWYKNDYMREKQMRTLDCRRGYGGQVLSLKGDLAVLERRDFGCDQPLGPDLVFSVDPALRAQHRDTARKARAAVPAFPTGATVTVVKGRGPDRQRRPTEQVTVSFPVAHATGDRPRAHEYFVRAETPDGALLKEKRVYSSGINLPDSRDTEPVRCVFARGELGTGDMVRFQVRPANCWGTVGTPLVSRRETV